MTSPIDYPAITTTPRYLTGDKAGLKEFLDKFDVRLMLYNNSADALSTVEIVLITGVCVYRSSCSIATVRDAIPTYLPALVSLIPCDLTMK